VPEGDTVFLAGTRLRRALAGQILTRTEFRVPRYATTDLSGRRLEEVVVRGKHLLFRIEGGISLHTHFKMEGSWHLYRSGENWRGPSHEVRVVLDTESWTAVGFRLPVVDLFPTADEHRFVGHLGPDPLDGTWDEDEAVRRLQAHPDLAIANALIDQSLIAGLGNVYKSEICFLRGVHPETRVREVDDIRALVKLAARMLSANRTTGNQITTGVDRPGRRQWVYGRGGEPCRRCGTPIRRSGGGIGEGRVTYWCPKCQPAASA
jgi:endonuclease-8